MASSALVLFFIVISLTEVIIADNGVCNNFTAVEPEQEFQYSGISEESLNATKVLDILLDLPLNENNINISSPFFKQLELMLPSNVTLNQSANITHLREQLIPYLPSQLKEEFQEALRKESEYGILHKTMNKSTIINKYLIHRGANVYQPYLYNEPYIIELLKKGRLNLVKFLIEVFKIDFNKVKSSIKLLSLKASYFGHLKLMQYLIEKSGLNVKNITDNYQSTLLHRAASGGHIEIVEYLVNCEKLDVNAINSNKYTPIMYATLYGHLNIIQYLISNNANFNINMLDNKNNTLIHLACQSNNLEELKYILNITGINNYSIILNQKNSDNNRPIHFAAAKGNVDLVKFLVENGANITFEGLLGNTALHNACRYGHLDIVTFLIHDKEANVSTTNDNEATPLHLAIRDGHLNIVKYLIENTTSNINAPNRLKGTPLHFAVDYERFEIAKYLLYAGADYNLKDAYKKTPLQHAKRDPENGIADMISEYIANHS